MRWIVIGFGTLGLMLGCTSAGSAADPVELARAVRPILAHNCFKCHGPDAKAREADMRLDTRNGPKDVIVPGKPDKSELFRRISSKDEDERMPPPDGGKRLSNQAIETIRQWIEQGAPYAAHWSYVKPRRPALPEVPAGSKVYNPIDRFILARLEQEKLKPLEEADRATLIRRVSLALTGLPPTIEEVDQFVADKDPAAYNKLVDRLLASKVYGENWARMWLDMSRYADSGGYVSDELRQIWAFRDYVIRSFNDNKPFDQFTIEQIAGDMLPHPTEDQIIATAMHRNTPTNTEGGTVDEEFRNVAVVDRVNTTMSVWMGTTMGCCQCHDHKYDPITQKEYFRLFAVFNQTEDSDRADEKPVYSFFTDKQKQERTALQSQIDGLKKKPKRTADEDKQLAALEKRLAGDKPSTVPIMRELPPGKRRVTHIQHRGNYLDVGPEVQPGLPSAFPPPPAGVPINRLTLARWLVSPDNPLTARVAVNHFWERLFGIGIVSTPGDFGVQGDPPSHPKLLDWLAVEFVESGWNVKHILRLMVTSAAYRRSSRVTPELLERDPDNRLLARGPRFRLPAEAIRDQALAVSGLLSHKMYGPPVRPPQPSFGLSAAFGKGMDWKTSTGEDRYRRAIYTLWRRTNPYPSLVAFDAPTREVCTVHRARTNTPLQALVTLDDPVYVEAAQALARRMIAEGGGTPSDRARYGFRLCLARQPKPAELGRLVALQASARAHFAKLPGDARQMATSPLGPAPKGVDMANLAAWTVVGNVLLNLDETLMSR